MDEIGLGKRLQQVRREAGYTQQQLCARASLSYSTLAKIERGAIKSPSIFTIQSIAGALGVGLDALLGLSGGAPRKSSKSTSRSGVKFVYFDLNDCLVRFHTSGFTQLARDSGQPIDVVESVFWKYDDEVNRGNMSLDEFNTLWAQRLGIMVDWKRYYMEAVDPMPGVAELVEWVSQNYYVGILSNTMPGFIASLQQKSIIPTLPYDAIIDSSVEHSLKPEKKIYEVAASKANQPAEHILLIDDSRPNLIAAEKLGWKTLWFDAYNPEESVAAARAVLELS